MSFASPEHLPWQDSVIASAPDCTDRETEQFNDACDQANERLRKLVDEINYHWGKVHTSADCMTYHETAAEAGVYAELERSPEVDRQFVEFLGVMYHRARDAYQKLNPGVRV